LDDYEQPHLQKLIKKAYEIEEWKRLINGETKISIAKDFNVSPTTIYWVQKNKTWNKEKINVWTRF
jgi:DNA invertase Pin-like site-specific DNA recombinase